MTHSLMFLLLILGGWGCTKTYTPEICLGLYTKSYKGHPPSAHEYRENCQTDKLRSTMDCQKVLENLIVGATQKELEDKHGPMAINCLTQDDLLRFPLRKEIPVSSPSSKN